MTAVSPATSDLQHTPLHTLHVEQGARMVPFAGFDMPVQYPLGVKGEHLHTRSQAGLFDVSHMGQLFLRGEKAGEWLESLVPVDIIDLPPGRQRYALFTNEQGGVMDDLMVSRFADDCLYLVVNAACKEQDIAHLQKHLTDDVQLERLDDRALLALQGPEAAKVLARFSAEVSSMVFMDSRQIVISGVDCFVSRSGYTGEDGYEISIPASESERIFRLLLEQPEVELIGLGARDSLRLESGLCLYGHDMTPTTTPVEASLIWALSKVRRADGARAGGFPGADIILEQIATKAVENKRVGLLGSSRAPVREGTALLNADGETIGTVTSGTFGPTIGKPVAMAYLAKDYSAIGTEVFASVRGKALPMTVSRMPFIEQRYFRG
ncbi:glycine cleavage system protein T [Endozoicomonas montiporae]|uniref:aminomethyltransferase n=2 Tax=Endozoicomonas montiporae TaxID=1027273 RepID=A0A081NA58_9GAMM|nr:glycine cleavage system aminomethyltransferase GcvT [Endozoicomonas montiporae]AMO56988.1 aminomethyltransferase [Endozoicomonas montiporae CL-33]KEQ15331.1 glycine cleavage system protein T [Endozoicomonas montiporae]